MLIPKIQMKPWANSPSLCQKHLKFPKCQEVLDHSSTCSVSSRVLEQEISALVPPLLKTHTVRCRAYRISSINRPGLLFFEEGWTPGLLFGHGPLFEHGPLYFHRHITGNGGFLTRHNIEFLYYDVLKIHHFQRCADENIVDRAQIMKESTSHYKNCSCAT